MTEGIENPSDMGILERLRNADSVPLLISTRLIRSDPNSCDIIENGTFVAHAEILLICEEYILAFLPHALRTCQSPALI